MFIHFDGNVYKVAMVGEMEATLGPNSMGLDLFRWI